jgi:hypothetical protein
MFDAGYFRDALSGHVGGLKAPAILEVTLDNGVTVRVDSIPEILDGVVVLNIHPMRENAGGELRKIIQEHGQGPALDRIVVRYESIAYVQMLVDAEPARGIGFRTSGT